MIEKLDNLRPGMVLAEDVCNFQGLMLLKQNAVLSNKNIRMLKSWGVTEICIVGETNKEVERHLQSSADIRQVIEKELIGKYDGTMDDSIMTQIISAACDLLVKRKQKT